jgi:hypothetical protein
LHSYYAYVPRYLIDAIELYEPDTEIGHQILYLPKQEGLPTRKPSLFRFTRDAKATAWVERTRRSHRGHYSRDTRT